MFEDKIPAGLLLNLKLVAKFGALAKGERTATDAPLVPVISAAVGRSPPKLVDVDINGVIL